MRPDELQPVLLRHLPEVPGVTAAQAYADRPFGLLVELAGGGKVAWTITGAYSGKAAGAGEMEPATEGLPPVPLPDLTATPVEVADVELAIVAALLAGDRDRSVVRVERYSDRTPRPSVRFGITVDFRDGSRCFVACLGTARAGAPIRPNRYYDPENAV